MWSKRITKNEFPIFRIMNSEGVIINDGLLPKITDEDLYKAYELMCFSRIQESLQLEMNLEKDESNQVKKVKKVINFLPSTGQEATEVGYAFHLRKGIDWFVPAYRNNAAWITAGYPLKKILQYWLGNEKGSQVDEKTKILPINIPIGTQYSHATGIAYAEKFFKKDGFVITTIGDGGTSEGEFFEAMNFASIHKLPVIFIVENNQWSLDTPTSKATLTSTFAQKGLAVDIPSIRVDGNDFFAVYKITGEAIERIKKNEGPSLIECVTYRQLAHSAFDIKKDYFSEEDWKAEEDWKKKDPIIRLKNYLKKHKNWSEEKQKELEKKIEQEIKTEIESVLKDNDVPLEDIFNYNYHELTPQLKEQLEEAQLFFENLKKEKQ